MAGKVKNYYQFWDKNLNASPYVKNIIKNGYKLPFVQEPPPFYAKNNRSSLCNPQFVTSTIEQLLRDQCIKEVDDIPYCVNPLTVAKKGKPRLVLDLRHVNEHIHVNKFKYENLKTVSDIFEKDYNFCTFDLKHGYHHIPIAEEHQKYLGFAWEFPDGKIRYFVFLVLPFGLASACYAFTKILRPLVKKWRAQGIKVVIYLDDGIFGSLRKTLTEKQKEIILQDLAMAGFTVNFEKSQMTPSTTGKWLGFEINTESMLFKVPLKKMKSLINIIQNCLSSDLATPRQISKISGHIISMSIALGNISRLFTRQMYKFVELRDSWDKKEFINAEVRNELNFWEKNLLSLNGFRIKENVAISRIVYTDASDKKYGGYIAEQLGNVIARGLFTDAEIRTSSTYRELLAVNRVLQSIGFLLKNQCVQWNTDNLNVTRIIKNGSTKEHLQALAVEVFQRCLFYDVEIVPCWIPREENILADEISKTVDTDNWSIDADTFQLIQQRFGNFTIDRFADNSNCKVVRFNSKFFCPGTENVNAFTENWRDEFNWLCPPVSLIAKTLRHMKYCKAVGVLLVPNWRSSYFWPLLTFDGINFDTFVKDILIVNPYFSCEAGLQTAFRGYANFLTYALLIDFQ